MKKLTGYLSKLIEYCVNETFGLNKGEPTISTRYEADLVKRAPTFFDILKKLHLAPLLVFMLSFVGVKGYKAFVPEGDLLSRDVQILEMETLEIPHFVIEEYPQDIPAVLKPAFDILWNACGLEGSTSYDVTGNWRER